MTELLVILVAVVIGGFVKGVTGSGLPVVAIPIMATFIGVEQAVVIMVIPSITSNLQLIGANRQAFEQTRHLRSMVVVGIFGVALGTFVLTTVDEDIMGLVLAAVIIGYIAVNQLRPAFELSERLAARTAIPIGFLSGTLQGSSGMSSPLLSPYLHSYRMPRQAYVLSLTVLFLVYGIIQLPALAVAGLLTVERLVLGVIAVIPIYLSLKAGIRLGSRITNLAFDRWVFAVLGLTAAKLNADAFL
ncbi:MAG: sulfite exporter TauE/SafE family protein [Actinomycetota bacterium]|nr:sulfite exporter TauE/SafE family protein [Actinomycetota bacterium]